MFNILEKILHRNKVLFCDLDGTLISTKSGKTFPVDIYDWRLNTKVIEAIQVYDPKYVLIVSNQGGIEKGYFTEDDFRFKISRIINEISSILSSKVFVSSVYCTSNNKENFYRKPNPGMIERFVDQYQLKKFQCLMIGDASGKEGQFSDSDKECAKNAGIRYLDVSDFVSKYLNL